MQIEVRSAEVLQQYLLAVLEILVRALECHWAMEVCLVAHIVVFTG